MVKKIIILLKDFLARVSVRVDCRGRKVLFVEEIQLRKEKND
jgi:hypothetical protein